ncbi:hypothetical protein [Pseudonocardia nigra]|uniref:hypothetical protein n=1 Tax=Pseudonocardia nigra TaxID=1921578 RepID=UPI001C5FC7E9|nr:hypothetical protein [Pseudonocardia nigra]
MHLGTQVDLRRLLGEQALGPTRGGETGRTRPAACIVLLGDARGASDPDEVGMGEKEAVRP